MKDKVRKRRRKLIIEYAVSLNICTLCFYEESMGSNRRCDKCIKKKRKARARNDRCSSCGSMWESKKYKTCSTCRNRNATYRFNTKNN